MDKTIWRQTGDVFRPTTATMTSHNLRPGVYTGGKDMAGLFLERISDKFEFAFKVYDACEAIVTRVAAAWKHMPSGFGVSLNGTKGTGKTVCAQLIANHMIDSGVPVIVVNHAWPIGDMLTQIDSPCVIIFDEFEKTHDADEQQGLLSVVDGLSRSQHPRLFLFTSNTLAIDANFLDRPSRIRYMWMFDRLERRIIEMVLADVLPADCQRFTGDIISYLDMRRFVTMDIVKAVAQEVAVFKESPFVFDSIMNISSRVPTSFKVEILDNKRNVLLVAHEQLLTHREYAMDLTRLCGPGGKDLWAESFAENGFAVCDVRGDRILWIKHVTDVEGEFVANICLPLDKTWMVNYPRFAQQKVSRVEYPWLDAKPEDWTVPSAIKKFEAKQPLTSEEEDILEDYKDSSCVYAGETGQLFRIRVTPQYSKVQPTFNLPDEL